MCREVADDVVVYGEVADDVVGDGAFSNFCVFSSAFARLKIEFSYSAAYSRNQLDYELSRTTGAYGLNATGLAQGDSSAMQCQTGWRQALGSTTAFTG